MRHLKQKVVPKSLFVLVHNQFRSHLSLFLKACNPKIFIAVDESPIFRDSLHVVTHHVQVGASSCGFK